MNSSDKHEPPLFYWIAHRGNIHGPNPEQENRPEYIDATLRKGYDCEIDVRYIDGSLFLGHDTPDYGIDLEFLLSRSAHLWIHCKNIEALHYLLDCSSLHLFWHQSDDYILTSKRFIWCFPGKQVTNKGILVMPEHIMSYSETIKTGTVGTSGVCSDYIETIKYSHLNDL